MIQSLLIANRGEIASRIQRTARRLGIRVIAVYSEADRDMAFVREADEAVCLGPAPALESYLRGDLLLQAARQTGAEAIHPGYGFLSENAEFAESVQAAGLIWVGAPPAAIRAMGLKDAAKARMAAAGVPVTPGYMGQDQTLKTLEAEALTIGYPVLIKAVAGGGGKGMRRVNEPSDFAAALVSCQREAASSFGDDRVLIEKYILAPRHIEVQVFGDQAGNIVHFFERDCSVQRRHQKVIEEAPAPGMNEATRAAVCAAAVQAAAAVNYVGAGTIEFIADASDGLHPDRIWFMEMNTRLQVEHPVTEAITGEDLVEWQLRVASGEPLPKRQDELKINGWAVEARLYAEAPEAGFLPSTGRLQHLRLPSEGRVDSGVEQGSNITPYYDPMIAKLIAHAPTRSAALASLAGMAESVEVVGVKTNAAFLSRALRHPEMISGRVDTGFIEGELSSLLPDPTPGPTLLVRAAAALLPEPSGDIWQDLRGFRMNAAPEERIRVHIGGGLHEVSVPTNQKAMPQPSGHLFTRGEVWPFAAPEAGFYTTDAALGSGSLSAQMPGLVLSVMVSEGEQVKKGQPLLILEAMKMEQTITAPFEGRVVEVKVQAKAQVKEGALLVMLEAV